MEFNWDELPQIKTPRLCLRKLTASDRQEIFAVYGNPEVMAFTDEEPFNDSEVVDQMLASVEKLFCSRESLEWGIESVADGRIIGTCGLHSFNWSEFSAEAGCMLAREFWGKGLMQEALLPVFVFARTSLHLKKVIAEISEGNSRSEKLFARMGFVSIGPCKYELKL
ncbi:MAG: hypothetical protein GQF41_2079 [Candidatus Rifleibacterium amylolyticum]|nr:MAG: hypothetical protein GQF41_2079 [Candidatus Rifleibacterium amylolyticum]